MEFYFSKTDIEGKLYIDPESFNTFNEWKIYVLKVDLKNSYISENNNIIIYDLKLPSIFYPEIINHSQAIYFVNENSNYLYGPIKDFKIYKFNEYLSNIGRFIDLRLNIKNYPKRILISELENNWLTNRKFIL